MINSPVSILPAAFKLGVHPETSKSIDGLIKEDAANWVVMSWLLNQSKNGKHQHCIDIGSHVGSNMLHMASLGCYTHSFETNKTIAYLLNYNAHLNRLHDKIRVHNLALPSGILTASEFVSANLTDTNIDTFQSNQSKISNWHDCIPRHHNISLVRIDVAGDESDTLQGLQTVFKQEFVEALQIAVHPSTRQSLSKNFSRHLDIYIKQNFTLQVIVGNCKSCPRNLLPDNNKIDVALTGDAVLKVLPWDDLDTFSTAVSTGNFLCYLWITRHSIRERLQIYPLHHGLYKYLEGKPAKGAGWCNKYLLYQM